MQIGGISPISQTTGVLNPVFVGRSSAGSPSGAAASPAVVKPSTGTTTAPASAAAPAKASHSSSASDGGGGNAAVQETDQATSFSTTVAGTQYSGSVADSDGTYTASIANLSGATASGSSAQAAENNLDARIDELV